MADVLGGYRRGGKYGSHYRHAQDEKHHNSTADISAQNDKGRSINAPAFFFYAFPDSREGSFFYFQILHTDAHASTWMHAAKGQK